MQQRKFVVVVPLSFFNISSFNISMSSLHKDSVIVSILNPSDQIAIAFSICVVASFFPFMVIKLTFNGLIGESQIRYRGSLILFLRNQKHIQLLDEGFL